MEEDGHLPSGAPSRLPTCARDSPGRSVGVAQSVRRPSLRHHIADGVNRLMTHLTLVLKDRVGVIKKTHDLPWLKAMLARALRHATERLFFHSSRIRWPLIRRWIIIWSNWPNTTPHRNPANVPITRGENIIAPASVRWRSARQPIMLSWRPGDAALPSGLHRARPASLHTFGGSAAAPSPLAFSGRRRSQARVLPSPRQLTARQRSSY